MFILNKEGTTVVYTKVIREGYKIRVFMDTWQLIHPRGEICSLYIEDLLDYELGDIDPNNPVEKMLYKRYNDSRNLS